MSTTIHHDPAYNEREHYNSIFSDSAEIDSVDIRHAVPPLMVRNQTGVPGVREKTMWLSRAMIAYQARFLIQRIISVSVSDRAGVLPNT